VLVALDPNLPLLVPLLLLLTLHAVSNTVIKTNQLALEL